MFGILSIYNFKYNVKLKAELIVFDHEVWGKHGTKFTIVVLSQEISIFYKHDFHDSEFEVPTHECTIVTFLPFC